MIITAQIKPEFGGVLLSILRRELLSQNAKKVNRHYRTEGAARHQLEKEKRKDLTTSFAVYVATVKNIKKTTPGAQQRHESAFVDLQGLYQHMTQFNDAKDLANQILQLKTQLRTVLPGPSDPIRKRCNYLLAEVLSMAQKYSK